MQHYQDIWSYFYLGCDFKSRPKYLEALFHHNFTILNCRNGHQNSFR